ncbi:DUF6468 domain-containing protein [Aurantimonas sp. C2-6-R+9]|uniref:DUF6468 domain-containing protein n=1 Tax=unclassified Aurantimonas TaxID=2638230 RepID=UPI002E18CD98|nr:MULTISPECIES: DUF6468 domain-containing protein [unclassified Aurantimonas]MEC5291035.1 DUF6468 domain-containing protein [Aurantimonas sp. C2-3-R2]MEC5323466.1 DUF6468 domain-containing protein [Aurantimonas sp. A3-2-R12]MEC5381364.1 DUF6468 domain-containing protein [Aurantimonas sp. C2-6-R+9]MEC5412186.1 DUF6468 domain-containing protein [Aurantimonas sp. C2-4-R8]
MTSFLTDIVLMVALVVTALRSGRMYQELRALRASESGLGAALTEANHAITRAADAVVVLKHEGVQTLRSLEAQVVEAKETIHRLELLISRADHNRARCESCHDRAVSAASDAEGLETTIHRLHASLAR